VRKTAAAAAMWSASLTLASMSRRQRPRRVVHPDDAPHAAVDALEHGHLGARWPGVRAKAELRRWRGPHHISSSVCRKKIGERPVRYSME
jgi:hypothetical protein